MKKHFRENVKVEVKIYGDCKYEPTSESRNKAQYLIKAFEVKTIPAEEILKETDESNLDPYNEYLILYLEDGDTATFRNSFCDMYLISA